MTLRAHYLQHVPYEGLGSIEPWLREAGYAIDNTRLYESTILPALDGLDLLIVMGGPMSVNDEADYPWLVDEKRFILRAIEAGLPVLGICLGAQLIASALGQRIYPNREKEIGWFPIEGLAVTDETGFSLPPNLEVFHWHGETFDLPPDAIHLARSEGCENQAFLLPDRVVGLQCHLETTPDSARQILEHSRNELVASRFVQQESEMLATPPERYAEINRVMSGLLSWLTTSD
jgi:GMP synthase-like glutamine amidotransferase